MSVSGHGRGRAVSVGDRPVGDGDQDGDRPVGDGDHRGDVVASGDRACAGCRPGPTAAWGGE
jgi:hypothetical protein